MKDMGIVQGSAEMALPLVIGVDTVYVNTNIQRVEDAENDAEVYEYHQVQYEKDEYIRLLAEQSKSLENVVVELTQITLGGDSDMKEINTFFEKKVVEGKLKVEDLPSQLQNMKG